MFEPDDTKRFRKLVSLAGIGAVIVLLLWAGSGFAIYRLAEPDERGTWGDIFGAINALFAGWAFLGLIIAILLQYEELREQRAEIRFSRLAQQESAKALVQQMQNAEFRTRLDSLNLLVQAQLRLLSRLDSPRTVEERERRHSAEERLGFYESQLAHLIEEEEVKWKIR